MDTTRLQTATIMQPQYRNRHHFMIFGGFLLKQTFELAFTTAAAFAHARPTFVSLDPSTFLNPVPVGSILYMTAQVVYTDPPLISAPGEQFDENSEYTRVQIRVDTKVRDVEHGHSKPTGQFNYTFNGWSQAYRRPTEQADVPYSTEEHQGDAKDLPGVYVLSRSSKTS